MVKKKGLNNTAMGKFLVPVKLRNIDVFVCM